MIVANRRNLLNGNSFIFGVSGSGKSLMAKQEIISIILSDNNADVILIDPEREYYPLVNAMNGEAIKRTTETIQTPYRQNANLFYLCANSL